MRFRARSSTAQRGQQPTAAASAAARPPPLIRALALVTILAAIAALALSAAGLAGPGQAARWATSLSWTLAGVAALCGTMAAGLRLAPGTAVRGSWLLYGAAAACWTAGAIVRDSQGPGRISALAAACWILFALLGIASFARRLPRLLLFGVMMLDALPVVLLIVAVVHLAEPLPAGISPAAEVLATLYPALFGLLAANAVQMLGIHRGLRRIPPSVLLFTAGFCLMALAALFWVPAALASGAAQGHLTDPLWVLGLAGLAAAGLSRAYFPAGYLELPLRERESGPHALPPAAALLGLIVMLAVVPASSRLLIQAFVLAASVDLFVRVAFIRREDVRLVGELARSQALAEAAADRARRSVSRLRLLADVTSRLSSLQLDELMQEICDTAREVAGARAASFGLAPAAGQQYPRFVTSGLDEQARQQTQQLPGGAALMRSLMLTGRAVRSGDLSSHPESPELPAGHPGSGSFLGVPVPIGPGRYGSLYLTGKAGGFGDEDETLMTLLAVNAGHAVANAELFGASQAQQAKLAEQNEQLRALDRMKDEFIALVSHELRTPLTSIMGFLELLADEEAGKLSDGQRKFVTVMHRNARRLLQLVGDLLFLAGLQSGELALEQEEVNLAALARSRVAEIMPRAGEKHVALTLVAHPLPAVRGDELRLAQLLDNLLSNAVKFTPPGGQVIVTVGSGDQQAAVTVCDTGIGIPVAEQGHIFERFFRAEPATSQAIQGTGLGLTICKAIVDAHGGNITVQGDTGRGTMVRVRLPLRPPPP